MRVSVFVCVYKREGEGGERKRESESWRGRERAREGERWRERERERGGGSRMRKRK